MKLTRQVLVALVLAVGVASLVQADARPRGGKHAPNAARHVGQHHRPAPGPAFTRKNAIGATTAPAGVISPVAGPGAAGSAKSNAIGARPGAFGSIPLASAGAAKVGPAARPTTGVRPAAPALSAHGGGISGTGMTRPGTAPGVVGGPAKVAGGINGTGMRPKK